MNGLLNNIRKQIIKLIGNPSGMSIVSVMTAFVILLIGIMMTTTAITVAIRVMMDGNTTRIITEEATAQFYIGEEHGSLTSEYIMQDFQFSPVNGGESFELKGNVGRQYSYVNIIKSQRKVYRFFAFDEGKYKGNESN